MKNRNEQPSAKQKAERELQNRNEQSMKNDVKNSDNRAKTEMRTNQAMKNCHKEQ